LRRSGALDLAILVSKHDCAAAGLFTRNEVAAAPVIIDREILAASSDRIRAVLANSGVANACTGPAGMEAARATQLAAGTSLGCEPDQVLVLSTGLIGAQLDADKVERGIRQIAKNLSVYGGSEAARAIMTTDTRPKETMLRVAVGGDEVTIGGMAKGSGMIHPNMATMLAVLTTDASIAPNDLEDTLNAAVEKTFNRITVDGDTSTNDSVIVLANGASGVAIKDKQALASFAEALQQVCQHLAMEIVRDGEGASRFVTLTVSGASDEAAALRVAKTIATSPLVKTAFAGGDANWGRILAAAGRAGVQIEQSNLALWLGNEAAGELRLVENGTSAGYDVSRANAILKAPEFAVRLDLGLGSAQATVWTCDLTHDYVTINADYRT
ncbi:MAG: bifunctional glutamate N-acetyltransferase/amino-acid acetyltransferase ArgJ, partial [Hyphomicrobium sp.]